MTRSTPTLEDTIVLSVDCHRGQLDKSGAPYALRPLRVMFNLGSTATIEEPMAALLHDVVEDCGVTLDDLRARGFPEEVVVAVERLTKRPEEETDYQAAIRRAGGNLIARRVKIADLTDSLDLTRMANPTGKDHTRHGRYRAALKLLKYAATI